MEDVVLNRVGILGLFFSYIGPGSQTLSGTPTHMGQVRPNPPPRGG